MCTNAIFCSANKLFGLYSMFDYYEHCGHSNYRTRVQVILKKRPQFRESEAIKFDANSLLAFYTPCTQFL